MVDNSILAYHYVNGTKENIRVRDYNKWLELDDKELAKEKIADMVYYRLFGRYIKPYNFCNNNYKKEYKNGFAMMASGCLLIETLMSFKKGRNETPFKEASGIFEDFFSENKNLEMFKDISFYENIRCGILHQGETKCGWKITREGKEPLLKNKTINATKFLRELNECLVKYRSDLIDKDWNDPIWIKCITKIEYIINNCEDRTILKNNMTDDILSIIQDIANTVRWNRYLNEHYLHHYFSGLIREKFGENKYSHNLSKNRKSFRLHPEWPTYRKGDSEEDIDIPYRRYKNYTIPEDEKKERCKCGHIDFSFGEYNKPKIGVEFKWGYGIAEKKLVLIF
jgi:hypothetical protein